ncbi:Hypothetical protein R9X50_00760500 [Acrodontium crateriforme]|uniref:Probable transporter MCH1 n=1 Tax=Acrodontium crateriforme TaxID=150365 RepID=A0AAQ3ME16_9PEZI|nr:Hypothetical protein R9X50_00760500 [Acrodontium crateriforme]
MSRNTSRPASHKSRRNPGNDVDKLDYHDGGRPLLHPDDQGEGSGRQSEDRSYAGSFFENVAEGILEQDRARKTREIMRYLSFVWAIINCLGAGSITAYSLYAPLFQRRLLYSQLQVNGVSITAELAMYLPVPLFGLLCDRTGPGVPSLLAGVFFGTGYLLAAFAYKTGPPPSAGGQGWPYWVMILAFVGIGGGTSCMYLSAVTTCAKNFGRGKYRGLALALPIACFGLSGMWQAQIGSRVLYEKLPDGRRGDVDVHRYFLFLGILLLATGVIGFFALRIVDEDELIDEAVDELERSGLLEDSEFFQRRSIHSSYGAIRDSDGRSLSDEEVDELIRKAEEEKARLAEEQRKKTWLLNEETRRFLGDRTMWWMAAGFFLVTGPGEAFINNLGTIIGTLYPPVSVPENGTMTTAATHVSIVAVTSTIARIVTGTLTDILAPTTPRHQHRRGPNSISNSIDSLPKVDINRSGRFQVSRVTFVIAFCLLMSMGQIILASGALQGHGNLFWMVSASIGAGYGAVFSLTPIIISVVWGVENFGTNWGIVATAPAIGATIWGLIYSGVYQSAAEKDFSAGDGHVTKDAMCYGPMCYAPTFWAMAVCVWIACGLWLWAWKGPRGWQRRGIAV